MVDERRRSIVHRTGERLSSVQPDSQLIDFVVSTHPAYPKLVELSQKTGKNTFEILGETLDKMQETRNAETLSESATFSCSFS